MATPSATLTTIESWLFTIGTLRKQILDNDPNLQTTSANLKTSVDAMDVTLQALDMDDPTGDANSLT